jgi:putative spermidine/putrescine transport system permease protein
MADIAAAAPPAATRAALTTADGRPLRAALERAQARSRRRAFLLVLPLLLFILVTFVAPIVQMLGQSVSDDSFRRSAPALTGWFAANPAGTEPDEAAYAALVADLAQMKANRTAADAGTRINYELPGSRSLFTSAARKSDQLEPPFREALIAEDEGWADPALWQVMRGAAMPATLNFYLAALDLTRDETGAIVAAPAERQIYVTLFVRTFLLAGLITLLTLLLGYPVAHLLAVLPLRASNLLMILVLLPFWTSLLVRTTAWIALLQQQGVINSLLVATGVIGEDGRLAMIYNQTGTIVAMTHILLPFMILPLYSVMRPISPSYVRAARSLGASSWTAFRRVYFPLTVPGIAAGALLVFILAVGYYITPALVGGASGQLISNLIAFHMNDSYNWSLAAALAALLLFAVLILYWLYDRLIGIDNLKLG